jgi:hypothetical protein
MVKFAINVSEITLCGMDDRVSLSAGTGFFSSPQHPQGLWGAFCSWAPTAVTHSVMEAQREREAGFSSPISVQVKNAYR